MTLALPTIDQLGPPLLEFLEDGRLRVTRRYGVAAYLTRSTQKDKFLRPLGTLDTEAFEGFAPPSYLTYADCVLVSARLSHKDPYNQTSLPTVLTEVFEEAKDTPTVVRKSDIECGPDGARRFTVVLVNKASQAYTPSMAGALTMTIGSDTGVLERERVDTGAAVRRIERVFLTQGLLEARRRQWMRGMLWVEFVSVGAKLTPTSKSGATLTDDVVADHTGGTASLVLWDDIERVRGLPIHTVRVALKKDGSALTGSEDVLDTYTDWVQYRWPGCVSIDNEIGFLLEPPRDRMFHATVQICLTAQKMDKPEMVSSWASAYLTYTPVATGVGVTRSASYPGYLAGSGLASIGTTNVLGNAARNVVGTVVSNPAYADFTILGKVISNDIVHEFTTAAGTSYRVRRIITINNPQ